MALRLKRKTELSYQITQLMPALGQPMEKRNMDLELMNSLKELYTKGISKMISVKGLVERFGQMGKYMKGLGRAINRQGLGQWSIRMGQNILGSGTRTVSMGRGKMYILMGILIRESGMMGVKRGWAHIGGLMEECMKVIGI